MAISQRISPYTTSSSPFSLALKLIFVLISCVSSFFLVKLSVPHIASLLSIAIPKIWTVVSAWLAPPYLFITVHLIIFVIWKLHPHKDAEPQPFTKPKQPLSREISPHEISRDIGQRWNSPVAETAPKHNLSREISPEILRDGSEDHKLSPRVIQSPKNSFKISKEISRSDKSCITEERSTDRSTSTASSSLELRKISKPTIGTTRIELEHQIESMIIEQKIEEEELEDDSMDATWKAIMEKIPRPAVRSANRTEENKPAVGEDESNRQFEDFIKKSREQIANRAY